MEVSDNVSGPATEKIASPMTHDSMRTLRKKVGCPLFLLANADG
jgi:hypothetical protein